MTVTNIELLKDLLRTPLTSSIYRSLPRYEVDQFLSRTPSGSLISMQPVREEFRVAFVYHAKRLPNHDMNSESITSRIHDDLELHVLLPSLQTVTISCNLVPLNSFAKWIPSDLFYRTNLLSGQTFFILSTNNQTLSIAYRTSSQPTELSSTYFKNLITWAQQNMKAIPSSWCEALTIPGFIYKLERFLGVELILDPDQNALCIQGRSREILLNRLFTDDGYDRIKNLDVDVCNDILLAHGLVSNKDLTAFPNIVKQRIAYFIQGFLTTIHAQRNRSHWQDVNPQSEAVVDVDSSDEDDVVMVSSSSGSNSSTRSSSPDTPNLAADIESLKKMTVSMKRKLLIKTEKAMCLGFCVTDIILVIIEKGAHRAALLSENSFLSLLCDKQLTLEPDKKLARPLSQMEARLKQSFCEDYPSTSTSQNMPEEKVLERRDLLFSIISKELEKRAAERGIETSSCEPTKVLGEKIASPAKNSKSQPQQRSRNHSKEPQSRCSSNSTSPYNRQHHARGAAKENVSNSPSVGAGFGRSRPQGATNFPGAVANYNGMPPPAANYNGMRPPAANYNGMRPPVANYNGMRPPAANFMPAATNFMPPTSNFMPPTSNFMPPPQMMGYGCAPPVYREPLQPTANQGSNHTAGGMHRANHRPNFRPIVIDGSNVSYEYSKHQEFDPRGMQAAVERFREMGVEKVYILVPRKRMGEDKFGIMESLQSQGILSYTPSRKVFDRATGREVYQTSYDDRLILQSAMEFDGVIVSNDQYRDLKQEKPCYETFINKRLLMYCFVGPKFYVADDPFGPSGPSLMELLCKDCDKSVQQPQQNFQPNTNYRPPPPPQQRSQEETSFLMHELLKVLPNDKTKIERLLEADVVCTNLNNLVEKLL